MPQGDKRLIQNIRERIVSADINALQAIAAAERASLLRSQYNDLLGDWYVAPGLQTEFVSSSPSLPFDVYGGLMVKPDNAAYFTVQPGVGGFLYPAAASGTYDVPYEVINDPGVSVAGALPFTSNAGGGAPRWDVVECQPVDTVLAQESRYIFNPGTGIATPEIVDKVRALRLTYRVRVGTPGGGFPGLAAGWAPLAVVCAPAGSSSLLTSDVWDVRPLVRERARRRFAVDVGTGAGYCPNVVADYRFTTLNAPARWIGTSESEFNGYRAGGQLLRSTPCQLGQFGGTGPTGGQYGAVSAELSDNQASYSGTVDTGIYLVALFPHLLPRWQRYSQAAIGTGRVPTGPRGILVTTSTIPKPNGVVIGVPMPTAAQFGGGSTFAGAVLGASQLNSSSVPRPASASARVHEWPGARTLAATIASSTFTFSFANPASGLYFPPHARRVLFDFLGTSNNSGGQLTTEVTASAIDLNQGQVYAYPVNLERHSILAINGAEVRFRFWVPVLPKDTPSAIVGPTGGFEINVSYTVAGAHLTGTLTARGWSADD